MMFLVKFMQHTTNMKAIIEFNLPDDQQEYDLANNALSFWRVLYELDQELRAKTKYAPDDLPQDKYDAYQEIRDKLHELMRESNVDLDIVD
jgi:hypothetical protein